MTVRLYVGNLPEEVDRQALEDLFTSAGEVVSMKVIRDKKTNKCRGFGFLTVNTQEQADQYIEKFNGYSFGDTTLKIEVAQPRSKPETADDQSEGESAPAGKEVPKSNKKRNRNKPQGGGGGSSSSGGATQPDPRWARQLQRIKEQLQSANQ